MESISEILDNAEEIVGVIENDVVVAGVRSIDGQSGDLTTKTINNESILGTGNIALATPADVTAEAEAREQADNTLQSNINAKQDKLNSTQMLAVNSGIDSTLVAQITTNQNDITTINSKIPAQASSTNKLADKDFVNSSISTETANYISNNGEPFTSVEQLEAYTGTVTDNDYAFVTGTDSAGNTYYDRYKASVHGQTVTWAKEYRLNNSSFTSEQWASINSGITTSLTDQITTNKNNIASLTTGKQDKLTSTQLEAVDSGITSAKVSKLDGIEAGAEVNTIETVKVNGTALTPDANRAVDVPVPTVPDNFFTGSATTTGEGTSISLANLANAQAKDWSMKGDTSQETLTGKNKLGYDYASVKSANSGTDRVWNDNAKTMTYHGVVYKVNDDGTILVTGTASSVSYLNLVNPLSGLTPGTAYILNGCPSGGAANTYSLRLYTSGSYEWDAGSGLSFTYGTQDILRINMSSGTSAPTGGLLFQPMIRLSTETNPDYEIFCGGLPAPNPSYPEPVNVVTGDQTVWITGKNLFDYQQVDNLAMSGTKLASNANYRGYSFPITEGQTYTISRASTSAPGRFRFGFTKEPPEANVTFYDDGGIAGGSINKDNATTYTVTVPSGFDFKYLFIYLSNSGETITEAMKLQAEFGSATVYEPYVGQTHTLELGSLELCKIDSYQDYIYKANGNWYKHAEVGKVVYDGSEAWSKVNLAFQTSALSDKKTTPGTTSNYFTFNSMQAGITQSLPNGQFGFNTTKVPIFRNDDCADAPAFKTWLSTHNTTLYYAIDTATDTQITDATLVPELEAWYNARMALGVNNVTNTAVSPNLAGILTIEAFQNNWAGTIGGMQQEINRLEARVEDLEQ